MSDQTRKPADRLDSSEGLYFTRQLEFIKARSYDEILADLKYAQLLPISAEAPSGSTEITWRQFKQYGFAKIMADYAEDFPRVDLGGIETTVKIRDLGVAYGYTIKDIRRAALANVDLPSRKAVAARRAIEEKLNTIAWTGDATYGIQGFIKYPGTTQYTVPATGTGATTTWSTKTPDQILTDLNGIVSAVESPTFGKEMVDTIILPMAQYLLIRNTPRNTYSDTTIFGFFKQNNPGVNIVPVRELYQAGTSSKDMFIAYNKSPDKLTFEVPVAFEQFDAQLEGMEWQIPCHAETAGVIVYYPMSIAWGEGI